jgi:hypothetical protein
LCPLLIETPALTCADAVATDIKNSTTANWMTAFFMATSPESFLNLEKASRQIIGWQDDHV